MIPEQPEQRTRAEALLLQAEQHTTEVALDFGMQFASNHRLSIDNICRELRESLQTSNEQGIDTAYTDLTDALSELHSEVRSYWGDDYYDDDKEKNLLFNTVVIQDDLSNP